MHTLGDAFTKQNRDSENNFLILRLLAATLVIYGHSFALATNCTSCRDFVRSFLHYRYSGDLGLHIFFVISGFLVTASFDMRKNMFGFLKSRALRIFPALLLCVTLLTLLGSLLTTLSYHDYFSSPITRQFFMTNTSLYSYFEKLPGVFEGNKFGPAVDGTLWTLWIESRLYLAVALLGVFCLTSTPWKANIAIVSLFIIGIFAPQQMILVGENSAHLRLAAFFGLGAFLYINRNFIPLNKDCLFILVGCTALSFSMPNFEIFAGITIAYGVFIFGFSKKIKLPEYLSDYSYGIYLYGWPVQQLIAQFEPDWGPYKMTAAALPAAWILGALSWHLVEKRALYLKNTDTFKIFRANT